MSRGFGDLGPTLRMGRFSKRLVSSDPIDIWFVVGGKREECPKP